MTRLTERDEFGNADIIALSNVMPELYAELSFSETNALTDALNKLAEYEDAEERGLLIHLPCDFKSLCEYIGGYIYNIEENDIYKLTLANIEFSYKGELYVLAFDEEGERFEVPIADFSKTAFLTPEAAQQALKGE